MTAPGHGLMTLREAAAYLGGVSYDTLRYWVYQLRLLPTVRLGAGRGHVYLKRADLDAFVTRGQRPAHRTLRVVKGGGPS